MDLTFLPSRGNPFCIEVGYFDTVLEIKEKIEKDQRIPISKQTLLFEGNVLQDELNIHYSEILDGSRIQLLVESEALSQLLEMDELSPLTILLLLKMPSSELITLEMDINDTIRRLKEEIHDIEGVPINRLAVHAKGIELQDHKSMLDYGLSDNSEIDVAIRPSPATTRSRSSSGNMNSGSRKLRILVLTQSSSEKIPVEVNSSDNVRHLREKLEELKLDLPQEGYFFIHKKNVMDDHQSFRWHRVCQGDTIETFRGTVSYMDKDK
ncbi:polyubiquitin-like [Sesamum indicum]|uniref:Polyubiquitin-like n=1 Tax=Sesamum indicum TaxID=4182 RepID=A0A6I9TKK5_SESIN|nr:polyubiquitin-like [Sesamum indicum]